MKPRIPFLSVFISVYFFLGIGVLLYEVNLVVRKDEIYSPCFRILQVISPYICIQGIFVSLMVGRVLIGELLGWKKYNKADCMIPLLIGLLLVAIGFLWNTIRDIAPIEPFSKLTQIYKDNQSQVDTIQSEMKCCGVDSYLDWKDSILAKNSTLNPWWLQIPNSCVKSSSICEGETCFTFPGIPHENYTTEEQLKKIFYTAGCSTLCKNYVEESGWLLIVAVIFLIIDLILCRFKFKRTRERNGGQITTIGAIQSVEDDEVLRNNVEGDEVNENNAEGGEARGNDVEGNMESLSETCTAKWIGKNHGQILLTIKTQHVEVGNSMGKNDSDYLFMMPKSSQIFPGKTVEKHNSVLTPAEIQSVEAGKEKVKNDSDYVLMTTPCVPDCVSTEKRHDQLKNVNEIQVIENGIENGSEDCGYMLMKPHLSIFIPRNEVDKVKDLKMASKAEKSD